MAETIVGLLGPLIEVGKFIAGPIKDQFSYLCCLNHNVRILGTESAKLNLELDSLEGQVNYDQNIQRRQILPNVTEWLKYAKIMGKRADDIKKEKREIEQRSCIFSMKSRYVLSKKAKKLVNEMKDHGDNKRYLDPISQSPLPSSQLPPLLVPAEDFFSRKGIEENIMKALREKAPKLIGICGMGGVGKTTMATKLMQRVSEEKVFHDVLKVDVGKDADVLKIQRDISGQLGLKLEADSSGEGIKRKLHHRLSGDKKIFILIDDIWSPLELADLGLPPEKCTILFTSRNKDDLTQMDVNVFDMDVLKDDEALSLFLKEARIGSDDRKLFPKAEEIVKECKGLPLALSVIGSLLRNKKDDHIWSDTLLQLKSFDVGNITDFDQKVYCVLKFSIDKLADGDPKKLLFLCSQFPEDANICLKNLALYCISLRLFRRNYNVQETRARVHTIVEKLKNRSLLLDGRNKNFVKMHDLIRDTVAKVIDEREKKSDGELGSDSIRYCKWISNKFPETSGEVGSSCRKLELLGIASMDRLSVEGLLSSYETREISTLVFQNISFGFTILSASINLLKNLRMLHIEKCYFECISAVGELSGLEILKCFDCGRIKELPLEIKELKKLKFIEFGRCKELAKVVPEVISNLVELEELSIWESFSGWESRNVKENEARNASIKEIELLKKLRVLRIDIRDIHLVEEDVQLPSSLENYGISIGYTRPRWDDKYEKWISLQDIPQGVKYANWICQLMLKAEGIAWRRVEVDELIIPKLEKLELWGLTSLVTFVKGVEGIQFPFLTEVRINNCPKITRLVSSTKGGPNSEGDKSNDCVLLRLPSVPRVSFERFKVLASGGSSQTRRDMRLLSF